MGNFSSFMRPVASIFPATAGVAATAKAEKLVETPGAGATTTALKDPVTPLRHRPTTLSVDLRGDIEAVTDDPK